MSDSTNDNDIEDNISLDSTNEIGIEDNLSDSTNDNDMEDNFSDSDNDSDDNISTVSSNSTSGSSVCCCNHEETNLTCTSKLYRNSNISQHEFTVAFLSMFHQHSLTYSCGSDVLRFLNQVLPSPNLVLQSPFSLIEQLIKYNDATTTHRCCGYCAQLLHDKSTCTRNECRSASLPDSSFIEVHLDKQLQKYFSGD